MPLNSARENMEEWGTSAAVEQETIRAVVEAYAKGEIELSKPSKYKEVRYAPSFKKQAASRQLSAPYTAQTVADFIGWVEPKGQAQRRGVAGTEEALQAGRGRL